MATLITAAASSPDSSSTSANGTDPYDVFISHRGPDVKNTFASHLYRRLCQCGLSAFLDKDELEKGENNLSQIEPAISGASVQIAILSQTYAESEWCLDELVLMKNSGATILPIFFKVEPSEVCPTKKDGVYAVALLKLQEERKSEGKPPYARETVQNWTDALSYVADLSGYVHIRKQDDEAKLLEKVVEEVLKKVPKTPLDVATYPTGLDIKLEDFKKTVLSQQQQHESDRVETKVIGIVGIGGVGKTTLAKEFVNGFFKSEGKRSCGSSFLSNVRDAAARESLNSLQTQLITDLLHTDKITVGPHNGIELFKKHLKSCHALIVLDDVDHISQLEAFLPLKDILRPGSLILVTSRDKHVLVSSGVSEQSIYHLKVLDPPYSQKLFCFYAFHKPLPPPEFADLVNQFAKACGGLPLSLKVFGAQVFGENEKSAWEELLDELILPAEIYDKLKISYDSLGPKVKEIFLDISCFFLGEDVDRAMRIWGILGIRNLQGRCLVEVDGENKIQMHDHIRYMGRKIAEEESLPLRLWQCTTSNIDHLLEQPRTVTNEVRGIKMVCHYDDIFRRTEYFYWYPYTIQKASIQNTQLSFSNGLERGFRQLRLVAAEEGCLEDILRGQAPHLIWVRWYGCDHSSLPDWIPMKNLRVLEVEGNRLNQLWPHQYEALPLELRELNIYAPLSEIPRSIGQLQHLERIYICCSPLTSTIKSLPDEFCNLISLKSIDLYGLSKLELLPDRFGELINLERIYLKDAVSLQKLPDSFGNLNKLKYLSLKYASSLQRLPCSSGNRELTRLEIRSCGIEYLPRDLLKMDNLQCLSVLDCPLREHPFRKVVEGDREGERELNNLSSSSDRCLFALNTLELSRTELMEVSFDEGVCPNLQKLTLRECYKLKEIGGLSGLESLTSLHTLEVEDCEKLHSIKLISLQTSGVMECRLGKFTQLTKLDIRGCKELHSIQGLGKLTKLTELLIYGCPNIPELQGVEHLTSLEVLSVWECEELLSIPGLEQLTKLTQLDVHGCRKIQKLPGVEHLTSLDILNVGGCENLLSIGRLEQLTELTQLNVHGCRGIRDLSGVEHLTSLKRLDVGGCEMLQSIPGLRQLTKLTELHVYKSRELPSVEHLTSLKWLNAAECEKLQSIPGLGQLTELTQLDVRRCLEIRELPGVEQLTCLERLNVGGCEKLHRIPGLEKLTKLTELDLSGCREMRELPGVERLTSLKRLNVGRCEMLQSIPWLGQLTKLTGLDTSGCREIRELPGVEHLTSLERLFVGGCKKIKRIRGLGRLTQMRELNVSECYELQELRGVEDLMLLKILDAGKCPKLQWREGVVELLRQRLNDGFTYKRQRKRCSCPKFLHFPFICLMLIIILVKLNSGSGSPP